jgi:DNA-directed RNA polymerase subunit RPC12/RpoP
MNSSQQLSLLRRLCTSRLCCSLTSGGTSSSRGAISSFGDLYPVLDSPCSRKEYHSPVASSAWSKACSNSNNSRVSYTRYQHWYSTEKTIDADGHTEQRNHHKSLMMVYTCGQCDTRSAKTFSKQAYEHGVVIVTCPGCESKHLISDQLGWFGEQGKTIEDIARERGISIDKKTLHLVSEHENHDGQSGGDQIVEIV